MMVHWYTLIKIKLKCSKIERKLENIVTKRK